MTDKRFATAHDLVEAGLFPSTDSVYRAVRSGMVPAFRCGARVRFDLEGVREWARNGGTALPPDQLEATRSARQEAAARHRKFAPAPGPAAALEPRSRRGRKSSTRGSGR